MAKSYGTKNTKALDPCWLNEKLALNSNVEKTYWSVAKMATKILRNLSNNSG